MDIHKIAKLDWQTAYQQGTEEASRDLDAGVCRLMTYGYELCAEAYYRVQVLRENCGITLTWVAGCMYTMGANGYVIGYNRRAEQYHRDHHGEGYFASAYREAAQSHKEEGIRALLEELASREEQREAQKVTGGWATCPHCGTRSPLRPPYWGLDRHHCGGRVNLSEVKDLIWKASG